MRRGVALVVFVAILVGGPAAPVRADAPGAPATDAAQQLADRSRRSSCSSSRARTAIPTASRTRPGRSTSSSTTRQIALRQVGNDDPVVKWAPNAIDLFELNKGFYLDFPGSALCARLHLRARLLEVHGRPARRRSTPTSSMQPDRPRPARTCSTGSTGTSTTGTTSTRATGRGSAPVRGRLGRGGLTVDAGRCRLLPARGRRARHVERRQVDPRRRPPGRLLVGRIARQLLRIRGCTSVAAPARVSAATPPPAHPIAWCRRSSCCPTASTTRAIRWRGWRSTAVGVSARADRSTAPPGRPRRTGGSIPRRGSRTSATTVS